MAAVYWNEAWLAFETTGGYGLAMARMCWQDFGYPFLYFRKSLDDRGRSSSDQARLGHEPVDEAAADRRRPRAAAHRAATGSARAGWRSRCSPTWSTSRAATRPEKGKVADLLMAWLIAQEIAKEKPIRPERKASSSSTMHYTPRDPRTGY
jgi:hypothetical protein